MAHSADFVDAHRRHWDDGELLFACERWANAEYLYGFSAECGLKAVMQFLGMELATDGGPADDEYRKHLPVMWSRFKSFAKGRNGERYLRRLPEGSPFADWSHHNRYAHRKHFSRDQVAQRRDVVQAIRAMVHDLREEQGA